MIAFPVMPFATCLQPPLAVGQFKAQFEQAGLDCHVKLFNFDFMAILGIGLYETVGKMRGNNAQLGEWLFAKQVWDEPFGPSDESFFDHCPIELRSLRVPDPRALLLDIRDRVVPAFLDRCCDQVLDIPGLQAVGFSCLFFQTMASAALARRIKQRAPTLPIAFGGASFHGEMGEELIRVMPWIDAVSVGEADDVIIPLFKRLIEGRSAMGLQGILWRDAAGRIHKGFPHQPASSQILEGLPTPDYAEYFALAERHGMLANEPVRERIFIPYESSRGCWWGQKKHCTFCGLNADGMSYRSKSAQRSIEQLRELYQRYPTRRYMATDNIMPHHYYNDFLPELAQDPIAKDIHLFFELKPNMTRERVKRLAEAGVRSSVPGVESLSSHILECLRKGVSAILNVHAMRLFREYGIIPGWSVLMRVPGEKAEDYDAMADMVPSLVHLWPPFGGPRMIELHRFSPYHSEGDRFTRNVKPQSWYDSIFPADKVNTSAVAYYFEADWNDVLPPSHYERLSSRIWQWLEIWTNRETLPHLRQLDDAASGPMELSDTRSGRQRIWKLDEREAAIYRVLDDPTGAASVAEQVGEPLAYVEQVLAEFASHRLVLHEGAQYLALALPACAEEPTLAFRQANLQRVEQEAEAEASGIDL